MNDPRLTVILPCHNEEGNVPLWESELFPVLDGLPFPSECLVVDDGSTDRTRAAAGAIAARRPGFRVVSHPVNRGLGAAIRTGFAEARGELVATLDSDLTFPPRLIPDMLQAFDDGADAVCASPFLGRFEGVSIFRRMMSDGANLCYRLLLGRPLTAVTSLCRLYRAADVRRLPLKADAFDINAEVILHLLRAGARIAEIPATLTVRKFGVSKISTRREIRNHLTMFARILRWRFGPS